jgi:hypothetical protein
MRTRKENRWNINSRIVSDANSFIERRASDFRQHTARLKHMRSASADYVVKSQKGEPMGAYDCDCINNLEYDRRERKAQLSQEGTTFDLISRQAAIDAAKDWYEGLICGSVNGLIKRLNALPTAQPEPLTDKEQRIFLAAMKREEKVCKQVDGLVRVCHEIKRKVKGALWTI